MPKIGTKPVVRPIGNVSGLTVSRVTTGTTYIGVDPGKSGGMARIGPLGNVTLQRMPDNETDVWEWFRLSGTAMMFAVIEKVHAMPKQGVSSMFTFGKGYGGLRMALIAGRIPFQDVAPEVWQRALGIAPRKKHTRKIKHVIRAGKNKGKTVERGAGGEDQPEFKARLIAVAKQMFPGVQGIDEYTADALLICEHARRIKEGIR